MLFIKKKTDHKVIPPLWDIYACTLSQIYNNKNNR